MNHKLLKASLAGAAALAVAAGGTTFAAWSDFSNINDNNVGAGVLKMTLNPLSPNPGNDLTFDDLKLAPGQYYERQVYVATNSGDSTPSAKLFFDVTRMTGAENGCDTNSEAAEDNCAAPTPDVDGDLLDEATLGVASYNPGPGNVCTYDYAAAGTQVTQESTWKLKDVLAQSANHELTTPTPKPAVWNSALVDNTNLAPGEGMCVAIRVALPNTDNGTPLGNKAQGDTASFDLRLTVKQDTFSYGSNSQYFVP
jgi:alternate signal-mediated exported protein